MVFNITKEEIVMTKIFGSPCKYIQGYDELKNIREHLSYIGNIFLVIASKNRIQDLGKEIESSFGSDGKIIFAEFSGESSRREVSRIVALVKGNGCHAVIGMGGGKVIDTAKAVANDANLPCVIIPTIAATDASTTCCSVIYNEDGSLDAEENYDRNPEIVLVDTKIIMNAPVRFLVSGMGDAISTYYGARVAYQGYKDNAFGGKSTELAYMIAKLAYDIVVEYGESAKIACENKSMTMDLEKVIEANVLLSGLGCESNAGASDHSFYYGFCALTHREEYMYHGEYVAFSTLCLMVMEGASKKELDELFKFCIKVGLPVCLEDMKLDDMTEDEFHQVAEAGLSLEPTHNHPFVVDEVAFIGAIKTADRIGKMYKTGETLL